MRAGYPDWVVQPGASNPQSHLGRRTESSGARSPEGGEEQFEAWLAQATERIDPFMAWLAVVFALTVGYELAVEPPPATASVLMAVGWVVWTIFLLEFVARLWLAPRRLRFVRRHWVQLLALLLPALRVLRFARLVRVGRALPAARVVTSSYRTVGTARRLFRSRLGYLVGLSGLVALAVAELAYLFERHAANAAFGSFGDAVLWAVAVVIGLQGDPTPTTAGARIVMLLGFAFGLIVVASLAASIGAFLMEHHQESPRQERLWPDERRR